MLTLGTSVYLIKILGDQHKVVHVCKVEKKMMEIYMDQKKSKKCLVHL